MNQISCKRIYSLLSRICKIFACEIWSYSFALLFIQVYNYLCNNNLSQMWKVNFPLKKLSFNFGFNHHRVHCRSPISRISFEYDCFFFVELLFWECRIYQNHFSLEFSLSVLHCAISEHCSMFLPRMFCLSPFLDHCRWTFLKTFPVISLNYSSGKWCNIKRTSYVFFLSKTGRKRMQHISYILLLYAVS